MSSLAALCKEYTQVIERISWEKSLLDVFHAEEQEQQDRLAEIKVLTARKQELFQLIRQENVHHDA